MTSARAKARKVDMAIVAWQIGYDWSQIADRCGYASPQLAQRAVEKALAGSVTDLEREVARVKAVSQLNMLLQSVAPKAMDGEGPEHLPAVNLFRGLVNDIVRITGAAAPAQIQISPRDDEFHDVVQQLAAHMLGMGEVEEADVVSEPEAIEAGVGLSDPPGVPNRGLGPDEPGPEGPHSPQPAGPGLQDDL